MVACGETMENRSVAFMGITCSHRSNRANGRPVWIESGGYAQVDHSRELIFTELGP